MLFYGQTQLKAQGLGLALALPGCSISLAQYSFNGHTDWYVGTILAFGGLIGVHYGVHLAHSVSEKTLINAFCVLLIVGGIGMLLK